MNAIIWIILLVTGALALPIVNWNTPQGGALETVPLSVCMLLSAYGMFRAVFRISVQASEWLAGLLMVVGLIAIGVISIGLHQAAVMKQVLVGRVVVVISLSVVFPLLTAVQLSRWTDAIKTYLTFRPYCNHCGYNLTGSIQAKQMFCPECGRPIPLEKVAKLRADVGNETDSSG